ncbi:MAG TPA: ABC-2 family transporter protein [Polyangiaceae bacterium]|nr:ABC-2 family transporter protein [Polyangiaceae bacterium]
MALFTNVYVSAFKAALQTKLEYRVDLVIGMLTAILLQFAALSLLWIVLGNTPSLGGWSPAEVLFLFGMTAASLGASELLFNQIWLLPQAIVAGDLDRLLTYPVNTLAFFLVTRPELHAFGNLLTGCVYVAYSLWVVSAAWYVWLLVPLLVLCGTLIYTSALVIFGCLSFRFMGPFAHVLLLPLNLLQATRYPIAVYPRWLRLVLLFAVPYASFHYLPARSLFGKTSSLGGLLLAPLVTALSLWLAHRAWSAGLRRYESSGS